MTDLIFPDGLSEIADLYDAIFCDVWGVIHNGRKAFHPACQALAEFRKQGKPVILVTNAPVQARQVERLFPSVGVRRDAYTAIASSGDATRNEILKRMPGKVWRFGTDESWERDDTLFEGIDLDYVSPEEADFMVCMGLRDQLNDHPEQYRDELKAHAARGLLMICANPDIQVRVGNDLLWCAGAIARVYEEEGGAVVYPGKPHDAIYDLAETHLERLTGQVIPRDRILAIGDGPATDIRGANRRGMAVIYVGTGLSLAGTGNFAAETRDLLEQFGVSATYAMPELCW